MRAGSDVKVNVKAPEDPRTNSKHMVSLPGCYAILCKYSCSSAISTLEGIENKQRLQTLSIDNAWSNKNFLFYLTFRMLQHTSSEVNGYNCYKHFKKYKNKEGNW